MDLSEETTVRVTVSGLLLVLGAFVGASVGALLVAVIVAMA